MNILMTIVIGGIVGWLASIAMRTNAQMGILANVLVGIVGSFLGGWLASVAGIGPTGGIGTWIVSILGAMLLIGILRAVGVFGRASVVR